MPSSNHLSFATQALRYFDRPHEGIRGEPLNVAAAWRGADLGAGDGRDDPNRRNPTGGRRGRDRSDRRGWMIRLSAAQVDELDQARAAVRSRALGLDAIGREDFPLPTLAPIVAGWAEELASGRGFVLIRGLPVERWGDDDAAAVFWGLGQHLGEPGAQNPEGDLLGHVIDTGEEAARPYVRRYRTAGDIAYHCDLADVVGLLCLRTPRRGGASRIVSSVSVYNEVLRRRPDLVARLYEPFHLDTRDEGGQGRPPYVLVPPCRHARGTLRTFYHSDYFRSAERHPEVPRLTVEERTLLDLYEEIASTPGLYLDMQFEPGDVQLLSNHVVLHARTHYEDFAEPSRKRHLLRLWLSLRRAPLR
jgi:hypothetical protein